MPAKNDTPEDLPTMTTTAALPALDAERADLLAELATARAALVSTVHGLTDDQLGQHPTVSALCLGGLIKHVTSVERGWMRFVLEGTPGMSYELPEGVTWADLAAGTATEYPQWAIDHQNGFRMLPDDTLAGILEHYEQVAAHTERVIAEVPDLSLAHPLPEAPWHEPGTQRSIRRVVMHLIAETIQHAGHADIIRESLDGHTAG